MLLIFIKYIYRALSALVVILPITLNVIYPSSIIHSIIYVPVLSFSLTVFFIYFEKQIFLSCVMINKQITESKQSLNQKYKNKNLPLYKGCESSNLSK